MAMFMPVRNRKTYPQRRRIENCKQLLRFEDESVDFLTSEFLPDNVETRGGALAPRQQMETLLRYFGDPGFQSGVANDVGVHRSTVTKTIHLVMDRIINKSNKWIKFPSTQDEMNEATLLWQTGFHMPTVIGALDCTHIEIKKPTMFGDEYINRKGYPSINVQVTCNAAEKIKSISAEWPGSVHDARIWRRSHVRGVISQYDCATCLLGDSGYGISPWLITPFKPPRNERERYFNLTHSKERVVVERVFGQVKKRFPILGNCVRVSLNNVPKVIVSCAVLHNVAKHLNNQLDGDDGEHEGNNEDVGQYESVRTRERGEVKRNEMLNYIANRNM